MHPSGAPELPHAGIDNRIAGSPALPGFEAVGIVAPGKIVECRPQVFFGDRGKMIQQMMGELAPADLGEKFFRAGLSAVDGLPDLARADFAKMKMRRS